MQKIIAIAIFGDITELVICMQNVCGCFFCMQFPTTQHQKQAQINVKSFVLMNNVLIFLVHVC